MKRIAPILILTFSLFTILVSCEKSEAEISAIPPVTGGGTDTTAPTTATMKVKISSRTFNATLNSNATATTFKALLPLTAAMTELNGNEKYYDFSQSMPANAANPGTMQNGDIMLYGSRTLVLFYKSFSTSYSYTRIGRVTDVAGLAEALGSGNATITFEP